MRSLSACLRSSSSSNASSSDRGPMKRRPRLSSTSKRPRPRAIHVVVPERASTLDSRASRSGFSPWGAIAILSSVSPRKPRGSTSAGTSTGWCQLANRCACASSWQQTPHLSPRVPGNFFRRAPAHALLHAEDFNAVARLHAGSFPGGSSPIPRRSAMVWRARERACAGE